MESNESVQAALNKHQRIYGDLKQRPETWDSMIEAMGDRNPWEPSLCGTFYDEAIPVERKRVRLNDSTTQIFGPHGVARGFLSIRETYGELADGSLGLMFVVRIEGEDGG
jgi:hypothetical protein